MKQVLYFPLTRIVIGAAVCWLALLGANSVLRLAFKSEGNFFRVIRWLLSTGVMVAVYILLFRHYENRAITELSGTGLIRDGLVGLFAGALCIGVIIVILYALGYYRILSTKSVSTLILTLLFFTTLSFFEELVFRGIVFRIAEESLGTNLALIISALLFGLAHIPNEHANVISIISAAAGGVLAGLLFSMTKQLWLPIFFHAGWNWAQLALGVAVSGMEDMGEISSYVDAKLEGPELLTGGVFGPENSIITIVFVLILSGVAYLLTMKSGNLIPRPF